MQEANARSCFLTVWPVTCYIHVRALLHQQPLWGLGGHCGSVSSCVPTSGSPFPSAAALRSSPCSWTTGGLGRNHVMKEGRVQETSARVIAAEPGGAQDWALQLSVYLCGKEGIWLYSQSFFQWESLHFQLLTRKDWERREKEKRNRSQTLRSFFFFLLIISYLLICCSWLWE